MESFQLIPSPDTIPAPSWIFLVLDIVTFLLHILVINVVLGGSLILLFSGLRNRETSLESSFQGAIIKKIPTSFALGVNLGVAPLLFIQVIYGHLIYSSSVLMAVYWMLIIPLLIIAYYGAYIHSRNLEKRRTLAMIAIAITSLIVLYIAFMLTNNMTLMIQPEKWSGYFTNRSGTLLNLTEPTLIPRYLHFVTASIAVGGLFAALVWHLRKRKNIEGADQKIKLGLQIFAIATAVQVVVGLWFLISLPSEFMMAFMGQNILYTLFLLVGIGLGIAALITGFLNKFIPTLILLIGTVAVMVINRFNLRTLYIDRFFKLESLELSPQYDVLALFLVIFVVGLLIVGYMLKTALRSTERRIA